MSTADNPAPGTPDTTNQPPVEQALAAGAPPQAAPAAGAEGAAKADTQQEELIGSWLAAHLDKADVPYQVLVVVLAFLLGSFAAVNSDVWMYLATGRLLAEGNYQFGVDPFSYSTEATAQQPAVPWINHSWLSSWLAYQLYEEGGAVLVMVKALLAAVVALLLLFLLPPSPYRWVSILCVLLVILAMSSRFLLQPTVISIVLLAVTVFVLHRSGVLAGPEGTARPGLLWMLPPLFALWVNLDAWFVLGPLTLFLCLVTTPLEKSPRVPPGKLLAVFGAGLVACLANPHVLRGALSLPPELGYLLLRLGDFWPDSLVAGGRTLIEFQRLEPNFAHTLSPLAQAYLTQSWLGLNVAGMSFFLLLLTVLLSFVVLFLARKQPEAPRLSALRAGLTLAFMVLALLHVRLVPFFAVVGGAVAILNWHEYLAWRGTLSAAKAEEQDLWGNLARLATGFLLFGLFFLSWPGWLNHTWGDFSSPRRIAWSVAPDPALKNAAEYLGQMHQQRKLNRGLNLSPEIANYCAWFAPGVKSFFDYRFRLFGDVVTELNEVRRGLAEEASDPLAMKKSPRVWEPVFSKYGIDHVIGVQERGRNNLAAALLTVSIMGSKNFEPVYADGKSAVLAWKTAASPFLPNVTGTWRHQAFGESTAAASAPGQQELAPLEEDPGFWKLYLFGQKRSPPQALQAELFLDYYALRSRDTRWRGNYLFARFATWPLVPAGLAAGPYAQDPLLYLRAQNTANLLRQTFGQDVGPPEALVLALRTLRLAQAQDPQDPRCYKTLANAAEVALNQETHWVGTPVRNWRTDVRRLQFVGALKQYLLLNPQDYDIQWALGNYYLNQNYLDLGLEHLQTALTGYDKIKSTQNEFVQERNNREQQVKHIHKLVEQKLAEFERGTSRESDPLRRVGVALKRHGLVQKARQILDSVKPALLSDKEKQEVIVLRMDLALNTGNLWEVAKALPNFRPTDKKVSIAPEDYWHLHFKLNAAIGDNRQADEALAELEKMDAAFRMALIGGVAQNLHAHNVGLPVPEVLWRWGKLNWPFQVQVLAGSVANRADRKLLRGLLALESGDTKAARDHMEAALQIAGLSMPFPDRKIAERYLQLIRAER